MLANAPSTTERLVNLHNEINKRLAYLTIHEQAGKYTRQQCVDIVLAQIQEFNALCDLPNGYTFGSDPFTDAAELAMDSKGAILTAYKRMLAATFTPAGVPAAAAQQVVNDPSRWNEVDQAREYLRAVFGHYSKGHIHLGAIDIAYKHLGRQAMRPLNSWHPIVETLASPDAFIKFAFDYRDAGYDVFVNVLPCGVAGKMTKADIYQAGMIWADLDFGANKCGPEESVLAVTRAANPDILVRSGGGVHGYWRVNPIIELTTENMDKFETYCRNKQLELSATSDPTANVNRILRLPGTLNYKLPEARKVTLLHVN